MLCPECFGSGWQPSIDSRGPRPCEKCGQLGSVGCCEGECSQLGACTRHEDVWQEWVDVGGGEG
jgi:hypothetical protein